MGFVLQAAAAHDSGMRAALALQLLTEFVFMYSASAGVILKREAEAGALGAGGGGKAEAEAEAPCKGLVMHVLRRLLYVRGTTPPGGEEPQVRWGFATVRALPTSHTGRAAVLAPDARRSRPVYPGSNAAQRHWSPSVTVQAVTARCSALTAARVVTRKTQARRNMRRTRLGWSILGAAVSPCMC